MVKIKSVFKNTFLVFNLLLWYNMHMIKYNKQSQLIIISIFINLLLSIVKIVSGFLFVSLPLIADGFNSVSDTLVSFVSLIANYFAKKPADNNHPLGHGRIEYLATLFIGIIFIYVSFKILLASIDEILFPSKQMMSLIVIFIIIMVLLIKNLYYIYLIKHDLYRQSPLIRVLAKDSLFDIIINVFILLGFLVRYYLLLNIDGFLSLFVGIIMGYSSLKILYDISNLMVGKKVDSELVVKIERLIMNNQQVLGFHNLVIHDYGIEYKKGSVDIELPSTMTLEIAHQIMDSIEYNIYKELKIDMVIHSDPILEDNQNKQIIIQEICHHFPNISDFDINFIQGHQRQALIIRLNMAYDFDVEQNLCNYFKSESITPLIIFNDELPTKIKGNV